MPPDQAMDLDGRRVGLWTGRQGIKAGRPTLVLVHGSGGSRLSWRPQVRGLDRDINPVAVDLPGHGETTGSPEVTVTRYASFLLLVLEKLALDRPPFLGGASLGGAVAIETALTCPEALAGLVLISSGARLLIDQRLIQDLERDYPGSLQNLAARMHARQADPNLVRQTRQLLAETAPEVLLGDLRTGQGFDRQSRLGEIRLPTLVLCGAEDQLLPVKASQELAAGLPGARLEIIARAGHLVSIEQHRTVNRAILEFVQANAQ